MNRETLDQIYADHTGKASDKWSLYIREYARLFREYRDKAIRLFEIGIENGGSLEIWSKYFRNATALIGCDIKSDCGNLVFDDSRIVVVIGDANALDVRSQIFEHSPEFDIIIDDGSHCSGDIIRSFILYFHSLKEGGIYAVEDMNCSYWNEFQGGLFDPYSSISFFKRLADVINHAHWGISRRRTDMLRTVFNRYRCEINEEILSQVHSVEFINSMCVVRKAAAIDNSLGLRFVAGSTEEVLRGNIEFHGTPYECAYDQSENQWTTRTLSPEEAARQAELSLAKIGEHLRNYYHLYPQVEELHKLPTVVVIIPFYNGSGFIERAVKSVLNQTVLADEFIVVNDGSNEEERTFLYQLAKRYPFRIIDKENGGQGSARNLGVAASRSDFICFLDQDDYFLEDHIEVLTKSLPQDDMHLGFVYADLKRTDSAGNVLFSGVVKQCSPSNPKQSLIDLLRSDLFVLPSASIVKREAFDAVGGFDPQLRGYEDDDLFLRIFQKGYTNYFLDRSVTVWYANSESTSFSVHMARSRLQYFKKLAAAFPDNPSLDLYFARDCIIPRFSRLFIAESVNIATNKRAHRSEAASILREYASHACRNRNISVSYKLKLWVTVLTLSWFPAWLITLGGKAARLPILRSLVLR